MKSTSSLLLLPCNKRYYKIMHPTTRTKVFRFPEGRLKEVLTAVALVFHTVCDLPVVFISIQSQVNTYLPSLVATLTTTARPVAI